MRGTKMVNKLLTLFIVCAGVVLAVVVSGMFGHNPADSFRNLFSSHREVTKETIEEKKELKRMVASETAMTCFAHSIWHAGWLNGDGNTDKAVLIGVVVMNLSTAKPTDLCTVFSQGLYELPTLRTSETQKSYIVHEVEIVSAQSSPSARAVQYSKAMEIAQKIETSTDYRALVPSAMAKAKCATKLLRARFGWLIWSTAGARDAIRAALVQENGPPVYLASDGTELFGKCP